MTRSEIRNAVKTIVGRNFADIDTVLNNLINTAVELFGNTISSIYDEAEWEHEILESEVDDDVDNWMLPDVVKSILKATLIDDSQSSHVYYPLEVLSPADWYDIGKFGGAASGINYDYSVQTPRFSDAGLFVSGRRDYKGRPRFIARLGTNVFVYPRPSSQEVGYILRLFTANRPAALTTDDAKNVITVRYPYALIWYVGALLWSAHLNDVQRGQTFFQVASLLLTSFATEQEISKLLSITLKMTRNA